jgi:GTPase SAR1 family protein
VAAFNRIRDIFERVVETKRSLGEPRPPIILVGNKSDTSMREVLPEQGQQLARSLGVDSFFEVSPNIWEKEEGRSDHVDKAVAGGGFVVAQRALIRELF